MLFYHRKISWNSIISIKIDFQGWNVNHNIFWSVLLCPLKIVAWNSLPPLIEEKQIDCFKIFFLDMKLEKVFYSRLLLMFLVIYRSVRWLSTVETLVYYYFGWQFHLIQWIFFVTWSVRLDFIWFDPSQIKSNLIWSDSKLGAGEGFAQPGPRPDLT